MIKKTNYNIKSAFSLIELMISVTILVILGLMMSFAITKKTQKAITNATGGIHTCYKDINGKLRQREEFHYFGGKTKITDNEVGNCIFELPSNATGATIYLIGAGGGGGGIQDLSTDLTNFCQINDTNEQTIVPINCKERSYYYNSNGILADCCTKDGTTYKCGTITGIDQYGKFISNECTNISINVTPSTTLAPQPEIVTNKLPALFSDEAYNNLILKDYVVSVAGGNTSTYQNNTAYHFKYTPNPKINDTFICYNGVNSANGTSIGTSYISPTPGIFQVNGQVKKIKGTSWSHSNRANANNFLNQGDTYGQYSYNSTPKLFTLHYQAKTLTKCKIPYGTNGSAGETITILGQNLANKTLKIIDQNIGTGGAGGTKASAINQTAGQKGGNTSLTLNNITRTAQGGQGGISNLTEFQDLKSSHNKIKGSASDNNWWDHTHYMIKTEYDQASNTTQYIKDKVLVNAINPDTFMAQPSKCTSNNDSSPCTAGTSPDSLSYGAGGAGMNSVLDYDPLYSFSLYKKTSNKILNDDHAIIGTKVNNTTVTPVMHTPNLITTNQPNNSGMGGAIVIQWGE